MTSNNKSKKSSNNKSKNSALKKKKVEEEKVKIEIPKVRFILPKQYSLCRVGMELYETDEENFEPYVSSFNSASSTTTDSGATEEESSDEESEEEDTTGYVLHRGEVLSTFYNASIQNMSFESDYKEMTSAGSIKLESVNLNKSYKGVRLSLLSEWEESNQQLKWGDLKQSVLGFITEQTFSDNLVEIKVSGMPIVLDEKVKFDFKSMKRSEILKEVILTAGLKPFINVDGLDDDVTNFSNLSSDNSSSDGGGVTGGEGEEIDSLVREIVGSETDELAKCKLIHGWLKSNVKYSFYECSKYDSPEKCLKHKGALNCADTARLTRAMMSSAGLKCYVVHRTTNGGHFWTIIEIGGKKYASDQTGSGSAFNTVWASSGRTTVSDGGSYTRKNGDNPDC